MKKALWIALCSASLCLVPTMAAFADPYGPGASFGGSYISDGFGYYQQPANPQPPADTNTVEYQLPFTVLYTVDYCGISDPGPITEKTDLGTMPNQMYRYIDDLDANTYHVRKDNRDVYIPKTAGYLTNTIKLPQGLDIRAKLVTNAISYLGSLYTFGGSDGASGFDCSGFVMTCYNSIGVSIPRSTKEQVKQGTAIDVSQIRPGDLIFYGAAEDSVNHVAMYIGGGMVIHSKNTGNGVCVDPYSMRQDAPFRIVNILGDQN